MPAILKRKATKATPRPARRVTRKPRATPGLAVTAPAPPKLPSIVNVHEAKTQLSRLLARVAAGEEITIARAGQPFARLVPLAAAATANPYLSLGIADALSAYNREHGAISNKLSRAQNNRPNKQSNARVRYGALA